VLVAVEKCNGLSSTPFRQRTRNRRWPVLKILSQDGQADDRYSREAHGCSFQRALIFFAVIAVDDLFKLHEQRVYREK